MKITVIGGTGLIGSKLVAKLLAQQHTVIAASPDSGINTITGVGLARALKDADVVVDVSNSRSFEAKAVMDFFQKSTSNLLSAALYAGVKHYVALSVVGSDRLAESGYMRAKLMQEEMIKVSGISYTILRSTQFFEFAGRIADETATENEVRISSAAFQPIAADDTVAELADIVLGKPINTTVEVAGPERFTMYDFIRYFMNANDDQRSLVEDNSVRYFGAELKDESLVPASKNPRIGITRFKEWLQTHISKPKVAAPQ
mgnify:CR=1 FL=1